MKQVHGTMTTHFLSINELKDVTFSPKTNKSSGCNCRTFNIIKNCFGELHEPLQYLFDMSLRTRVFSDSLKMQKQSSIGVLKKSCFENMHQIYRGTPMPKCDFKKIAKQLY